jgi:putative salt-induced outer membrane protein
VTLLAVSSLGKLKANQFSYACFYLPIQTRRNVLRKLLAILSLVTITFFPLIARGDQVVLKNGDRLSGTILTSDTKSLVIKTEFAGEITIQWAAIDEIHGTQPLHVDLKDAQPATGIVTVTDGRLIVETPTGGTVTVSKEAVLDMRSPDMQASYEQSQHPRLTQGWTGGTNAGFALTAGNSETKNLALAFIADRKSVKDHVALYANSVYARSDAAAGVSGTTANSIQSGIRYERNLSSRTFGFGSGDFQTDALQTLDLRSVYGAGFGYHIINNDRTTLDLLAGANYTREDYTTLHRNVAGLTTGEELTHKYRMSTLLTQKLYFFPALNEAGEYRSTFKFGTLPKISKWLVWKNDFGDIYVTNPPAVKNKNDITLTTGLNVTFAH